MNTMFKMSKRMSAALAVMLVTGLATGFAFAQMRKPNLELERAAGVTAGSHEALAKGARDATSESSVASIQAAKHWRSHIPTTTVTVTRTVWEGQ